MQRFGKYVLEERLAAGGMAEVFLARDPGGRTVALKRILRAHRSPEFVRMFTDEACIASALDHPNVVKVHDYGQVGGEPFLAMEYVAGESLARVIDRVRERGLLLPEAVACYVGEALARALAHAHALTDGQGRPLGLVHRDVSPQNVLLGYDGAVKLADFGVARAYAQEIEDRERTRVGLVKGKYLYFAPEQARARPLDGRADVFAGGVVLYEMLCGRLPYDGEMMKVLFRVVQGEFSRPSVWRPDLSPELEAIVLLAMATDRERRFPTAADFADALRDQRLRTAPQFDQARLSALMRLLFAEEIAARGLKLEGAPQQLEQELSSWSRMPATSGEATSPLVSAAPTAGAAAVTAPRPAPAEPAEPVPDLEAPWLVLEGGWTGREFACIRTALTVGRSREADIHIDDPSLEPVHARLVFEGGAWRVMASPGARVQVNGARVRDGRLRPGDALLFGAVAAHFQASPGSDAEPPTRLELEAEPPTASEADAPVPGRWRRLAWVLGAALLGAAATALALHALR